MKKIIILFTLGVCLLSACKKDSFTPAPGEKPEERMYKALAEYKEELINYEYGWKAYLYADGGVGAGFYMEFDDNDRVKMLADLTEESLSELHESGYRLKAVMAPSLIFDTDNYIHLLANPDPSEFGGQAGAGFGSDFEFEFRGQEQDTLQLLGKKRKSKFLLIKATKEEQTEYLNGGFKTRVMDMEQYIADNPYLYILPEGEEKVQLSVNIETREASLTWIEAGKVNTVKQAFAYSVNGIHLKDSLSYNDVHIQEIKWEDGFTAVTYSGQTFELNVSISPLVPLYMLMGSQYSTLYFPQTLIPGGSPSFNTMWAQYIKDIGPGAPGSYEFNHGYLTIDFDTINERLMVGFFVSQNGGESGWTTNYPYYYTLDDEGVYTLTLDEDNISGPKYDTVESLPFITKFNKMRLKLDYHVSGTSVYGKIIDADDPDFYMVGQLLN